MNPVLIFLLAEVTTTQLPLIAPSRVTAELAADANVLRSLKKNGDNPNVIRPVDVRFVGSTANIAKLQKAITSMGWHIVQRVSVGAAEEALDVQRDQTSDKEAIRRLTKTGLGIEAQFGVRYDGWGTVATKR